MLGAFVVFLLLTGYIALSSFQIPQANAQILHLVAFFVLTLLFYWIFDSTRRRVLNFTLSFVTLLIGLGSEVVQGFVSAREFDPLNIAANIIGSLCALGLCSIYHRRMLDRRRRAKGYGVVPQEGEDVEMGVQGIGVVDDEAEASSHAERRDSGDGDGDGDKQTGVDGTK